MKIKFFVNSISIALSSTMIDEIKYLVYLPVVN